MRPEPDPPRVVVCGLGRFGLGLVECLRRRGAAVTVVTDAATREDRRERAAEVGAEVVLGDFRFGKTRERARVAAAQAVVLASASDEANLETALDVRGESPDCRIVMRLDAGTIARRLSADFGIDAVLSPASVAARDFSRAALEAPRPPAAAGASPGTAGRRGARRSHAATGRSTATTPAARCSSPRSPCSPCSPSRSASSAG